MFYQLPLADTTPYVASLGKSADFSVHTHHEIEMMYCINGGFTVNVNGKPFPVSPGELIVIGSMAAHEYVNCECGDVLLIEIGPFFLKKHFRLVSDCCPAAKVFPAKDGDELKIILDEFADACRRQGTAPELQKTGCLYRLCAAIVNISERLKGTAQNDKNDSPTVGKALELIYYHYREDLTVEKAAELSGYGKSNFCRIFKENIGMSFHNCLNLYRVNNARYFLSETDSSMAEIAYLCGFAEQKTFCRVFKNLIGMTPSEYRRSGGKL